MQLATGLQNIPQFQCQEAWLQLQTNLYLGQSPPRLSCQKVLKDPVALEVLGLWMLQISLVCWIQLTAQCPHWALCLRWKGQLAMEQGKAQAAEDAELD